MADPQQAASGSSPAQGAGSTAASTGWEAEKAKYEAQLRGLSDERNRYKQSADAWGRLAQEARDAVIYGPDGLPTGWNVGESQPNSQPGYAPTVNPWTDSGIDANQANAWYQQNFQALAAQQGFITQAQASALAQQAAQQAYQAANHRFTIQRSVDKLFTQKDQKGNLVYGDLSNPASDWSKRTAAYLTQYQAGQAPREGAGWDEWNFTAPQVLQQAADITYAQMIREQGAANASQQQAIQNQQVAGISAGPTGVPVQLPPEAAFEKTLKDGGLDAGWQSVTQEMQGNWQKSGLLKP